MAYRNWRERPLEGPMGRVIKTTTGAGKVRYRVEVYCGVTLANFKSEEDWREVCQRKSLKSAQKIAARLDRRRRKEAISEVEILAAPPTQGEDE